MPSGRLLPGDAGRPFVGCICISSAIALADQRTPALHAQEGHVNVQQIHQSIPVGLQILLQATYTMPATMVSCGLLGLLWKRSGATTTGNSFQSSLCSPVQGYMKPTKLRAHINHCRNPSSVQDRQLW